VIHISTDHMTELRDEVSYTTIKLLTFTFDYGARTNELNVVVVEPSSCSSVVQSFDLKLTNCIE